MSNVQIPNLPSATSLNGTEQLEAVQSGTSVRTTVDQVATYVNSTYPAPGVTQIDTAGGLSGGPITSTGTIQIAGGGVTNAKLADMPTATIKGNDGLSSGPPQDLTVGEVSTLLGLAPSATTDTTDAANITSGTLNAGRYSQSLSQAIDLSTSNTDAAGALLYRGATEWDSLSPATAGHVLSTQGPGLPPAWIAVAGTGTVTQINTGTGLTGGPIVTSGTIAIDSTGVAAGAYGTATAAPTFTVNAQGQLLAAGTVTVTPAFSSITSTPTTLAGYGVADTGVTAASYGSQSSVGTFTVNAKGQLTAAASVPINAVALTTGTVSAAPTSANDIANKAYVDSISAGINFHQAVNYASAAALPAYTYNNGTSGVGATITANANGALSLDSYTFVSPGDVGKRVLIKNETSTSAAYNGVYTVTQVGNGSTPFILTRATDYNTSGTGANQIDAGDFFLVLAGTTNANTSWIQQTALPIVVGTTALVFIQFAGTGSTYTAGTGLNLVGNTFNIADTTVAAGSYGSASAVPVIGVNAQGQLTSASSSSIAIDGNQITTGTIDTGRLSGSYTGITGVGTLSAGTWNGSTITVAYGGTGSTTLTGYVKGSGTSALTASTTIPNTDITGLGTMSTQNADAVALTGPATIDVNSASTALRITQTGAGNALVVEDNTNPDSTPFIVDTSGNVLMGTTTSTAKLTMYDATAASINLSGDAATAIVSTRYSTDATGVNLTSRKARGTFAAPAAVATGDTAGMMIFSAYGGTNFRQVATIAGAVDTYTSDTNVSGRIVFNTNSGGTSVTERMRLDPAGALLVGTTTNPNSSKLHLSTGGNSRMLQLTGVDADSSAGIGLTNDAVEWAFGVRGDVADGVVLRNITASVDAVTVTTGGNVNIATNGKAQKLYVNGNSASVISALTDGATITPDFALANNFSVTLGGNRTLANPTNLEPGQSGVIFVSQDATGSRTLAYGTSWDFPNLTAPTLTTTANAVDVIVYTVRSSTSIAAQLISNIG